MAAARKHGYRKKRQFEAENRPRKASSSGWKSIPSRNRLNEENDETIYNTQ